jgi:hypothetical protein
MKKPKMPKPRAHRALFDEDSPFHYNRVEQQRQEDRRETKHRKRPQDYLEDEDDDLWDDGYDR